MVSASPDLIVSSLIAGLGGVFMLSFSIIVSFFLNALKEARGLTGELDFFVLLTSSRGTMIAGTSILGVSLIVFIF